MLYHPTDRKGIYKYRQFGYFLKSSGKYHCGWDYASTKGDPVFAVSDGIIIYTNYHVNGFGGFNPSQPGGVLGLLFTKNNKQYVGIYGHVNPIYTEGDHITGGTKIAYVHHYYDTGKLYDHLHFAIVKGNTMPTCNWGYVLEKELIYFENPQEFLYS